MEPTVKIDGTRLWVLEKKKDSPNNKIEVGDAVKIHYWVSTKTYPRYDNSYQRGEPFELVMGDGNIVPGLFKSLQYAEEGDKLMIQIPAEEAYADKGLVDYVKPGQGILYDVLVMEVSK
jgi:peptidylprolyl isomerase